MFSTYKLQNFVEKIAHLSFMEILLKFDTLIYLENVSDSPETEFSMIYILYYIYKHVYLTIQVTHKHM